MDGRAGELTVARIQMDKELMQEKTKKDISAIQDETHQARERAFADAVYYKQTKEAESNKALLSAEYLEYMHILALSNNTKVYFGEKIPSLLMDKSRRV